MRNIATIVLVPGQGLVHTPVMAFTTEADREAAFNRLEAKIRKTKRLPGPSEAEWEASRKQAEIRKTCEPQIDWSSSYLKTRLTEGEGLESLAWSASDWRLLPSLRKHQHSEDFGGLLERIELPRCQHGVYLTNDALPELDYEDNVIEWKAPYCYCCFPEWVIYWTYQELKKGYRFLRTRPLEQGESKWLEDKLLDGRKVYPEVFTKAIKLRGRTLTSDLRLQEDPETGKPRLETMGGYVAKEFGYGRAGMGHGPDSDADDIRMAWLAGSEGSPSDHDSDDTSSSREGWTAALPSVCPECLEDRPQRTRQTRLGVHPRSPDWHSFWGWQGITEENWQPYSFPVWRGGAIVSHEVKGGLPTNTNLVAGLGLKVSEFFGDERLNSMDPATMLNLISWGRTRRHQQLRIQKAQSFLEERIHNPKYLLDGVQIPDSSRALSFVTFYTTLRERKSEHETVQYRSLRWLDGPADWQRPLVNAIEPEPRPEFPDLENWHSPVVWMPLNGRWQARLDLFRGPYDSERRTGHWDCCFDLQSGIGMPTAKHFAQWGRKAEYKRGGGVHHIPRRRTPYWSADWRTERPMRDLAANLKMYRWGVVNKEQDELPDIPAKVAQRCGDGTTREIQVEEMCATAYENYRKARLALATNCGKVGYWKHDRLEGE